jgi:AcrR family transcriptional regulator
VAFGKPGRPREDRLLRQREIYSSVAPLLLELGVRRLTMRDAARIAYVSVGALYHYFPTKRDLVLHALQEEPLERFCHDYFAKHFGLRSQDPWGFFDGFVEFQAQACLFVRPSVQAAVELGAEAFWPALDGVIELGLAKFADALRVAVPDASELDVTRLARSVRHVFIAGMFDRSVTVDELREEIRAVIEGARSLAPPVGTGPG